MAVEQFRLSLIDRDLLGKSIIGTSMEGKRIRYISATGRNVYQIFADEIEGAGYKTVPETIELKTEVVQNPEYEVNAHRDRALEC